MGELRPLGGVPRILCACKRGRARSDESDRLMQVREQYGLTKRETEVLSFLAEGRSSSYIAGELYLSDNTVRSYVKNIYQKLDVHSKQDLIDFMKNDRLAPCALASCRLVSHVRASRESPAFEVNP